jgi:hypothetical protein
MAVIKRKGILAKPGEIKYGDKIETRTAEELKYAVQRQHEFILTYGHPTDGTAIPTVKQFIGVVSPYWDSEKQMVLADYSFYDEYWNSIPESIRKKIVNLEPVPASIGITVDDVKDGAQKGIMFTHVALVPEGEKPLVEGIGVNMRAESKRELALPPNYREESTEIKEPEVKAKAEAPKASEYVSKTDFDAFTAKIDALLKSQKPPEREPEVKEKKEPEPQRPKVEEPKLAPEVLIPAGAPVEKKFEEQNGWIIITPRPKQQQFNTKKE